MGDLRQALVEARDSFRVLRDANDPKNEKADALSRRIAVVALDRIDGVLEARPSAQDRLLDKALREQLGKLRGKVEAARGRGQLSLVLDVAEGLFLLGLADALVESIAISEPVGGGEQGGRCVSAPGGHLPRPVPSAPAAAGEETSISESSAGQGSPGSTSPETARDVREMPRTGRVAVGGGPAPAGDEETVCAECRAYGHTTVCLRCAERAADDLVGPPVDSDVTRAFGGKAGA